MAVHLLILRSCQFTRAEMGFLGLPQDKLGASLFSSGQVRLEESWETAGSPSAPTLPASH